MKTLRVCLIVFAGTALRPAVAQELPDYLTIQAEIVNLRTVPDIKGEVVDKLQQLDRLQVFKQMSKVTIDGVTDYWYKVVSQKGKYGYVFGHLTSLKLAGRRTVVKRFTGCRYLDNFHITFEDREFSEGDNNIKPFELCVEPESEGEEEYGNPKYMGDKFELVINSLLTKVTCPNGSKEVCIKPVDTIIRLRLVAE